MERAELQEFELLEEAANMSYSSQLSLFNEPPPKQQHADLSGQLPRPGDTSRPSATDDLMPVSDPCPEQERREELQAALRDKVDAEDLDETLKFSPSLARGVEFNDEEAWESFSHGSPAQSTSSRRRTESGESSDTTLSHHPPSPPSPCEGVWKSPVKREVLVGGSLNVPLPPPAVQEFDGRLESGRDGGKRRVMAAAVERHRVPSGLGYGLTRTSNGVNISGDKHSSTQLPQGLIQSLAPAEPDGELSLPPPPSALVSKLFPVLRRVEEPRKVSKPSRQASEASTNSSPSSPVSSVEGDSGIRSLSSANSVAVGEEVRGKLAQLEEEIARYRVENTSLERLRKEREDVSITLCENTVFDDLLSHDS